MANTWFRMYTEFRHDPKVRTMSDSYQIKLVRLFCLRGEGNTEKLDPDELCFGIGCSFDELAEIKKVFLEKEFIDENWVVLNWDKRQFLGQKSSIPTGGARSRGYVYYVADRSNFVAGRSLIKIGFSSNPWARIKELRTAIPGLDILGMEPGDFDHEVSIHQKFKHLRKDGEWFLASEELTGYVATLRSSYVAIPTVATNRTEQNRTEQNKEKTTPKAPPSSFFLPSWIDKEAWDGFEEMRKKIRAPLTDRARNGIVRELQKICPSHEDGSAILDQSTNNSWRGVFPLKSPGGTNVRSNQNHPSPAKERVEANRRALADIAIERGWFVPPGAAQPDNQEVSEPRPNGCDSGIHDRSGEVSPEVLPPKR